MGRKNKPHLCRNSGNPYVAQVDNHPRNSLAAAASFAAGKGCVDERLIVRRRRCLWRFCSISLIAGESLSTDFFVSRVIIKFISRGKDCHTQER
jgi:hypothetical protein